jgi:zinc protease
MHLHLSRLGLGVVVAAAAITATGATAPKVSWTDHKLPNGLRVLVAEDHHAPVVSVAIVYNVGSRDERKGRTGFAHLFEHMMFKGSANVADGEHSRLIQNNGGRMNATTDQDRTLYYDTLPANQLDLVLFLEADRMRSLDISKENLDNQRNAVQEERRLRLDNQPYGRTFEVLQALAYENSYKHLPIGSMEDLNAASVEDVAQFFKTYYAPNNAVMAIVGDVPTEACLTRIKKYFGDIPGQAPPPQVDMTEPPQTAERRQRVEDPLARLTRFDVAYKIPDAKSPDLEPLQVLSLALGGGRSSRLYQSLVRDKQVAAQTGTAVGETRGPGLFQVFIAVAPGKPVPDVEAALDVQLEAVKTVEIAAWELDKARNAVRRSFIGSLGSSFDRAVLLAEYTAFLGKPDKINTQLDEIAAVSAADVQRVARKYLRSDSRTVVVTIPKADAKSDGSKGGA